MKTAKISIILPSYKKEKIIKPFLKEVVSVVENSRWDYELIVVQDGIFDKTAEKVKSLKNKKIKVFGYKTNRGKGYAVRYGMARASTKSDIIMFFDVTKKISPSSIPMILEHMYWYKADAIIASKRHPASVVEYTTIRRIYSFFFQMLVFILFRLNVKDTQVGLKAFNRELLEKVMPRLLVKQYAFDLEMLAVAKHLGYGRIYEAPVELDFSASESTITSESGILLNNKFVKKMIWDTFAIFYRMYFLRYYSDSNKRKWRYDKELEMRVNTGE